MEQCLIIAQIAHLMFRLLFIFKPGFYTNKFLISRCKYTTDSAISAMMLIDALHPCCVDYSVTFTDGKEGSKEVKYTPSQWRDFRLQLSVDTMPTIQKELF